jgi:dephospho-CoA kinase
MQTKELLNGSSIFVVGMMGSGKSSVAKVLGEALKYTVLDRCERYPFSRGSRATPSLGEVSGLAGVSTRPARYPIRA